MIQQTTDPNETTFDSAVGQAVQRVRGALTELLSAVGADPGRPQDISRRFGINKNLAWKLSKIATVTEPHEVLPNVPGSAGMRTALDALERGGAPAASVEATHEAVAQLERVIEVHLGDRSTLQLVLSSGAPEKVPTEHLHSTRKMAFQGNSAIWGVQARVRMASFFLAPHADDATMLDTASVGGLLDVRRLRADASVPFFMRFAYNDDGSAREAATPLPIEDSGDDDPLMLMRSFCSKPIPSFRRVSAGASTRYQLPPGPIGNRGLHSWVYGECSHQFASIYRDEANTFGEHAVPLQLPVEWLVADLQIHRDLAFAMRPRVRVLGRLMGGPEPMEGEDADVLPIAEHIQGIGQPAVVATPLIPRYPDIVQAVHQRMGWDANDFVGFRFVMKYPPMPTSIVLQHDLAER